MHFSIYLIVGIIQLEQAKFSFNILHNTKFIFIINKSANK